MQSPESSLPATMCKIPTKSRTSSTAGTQGLCCKRALLWLSWSFIFELALWKWHLMGQWIMCVRTGDPSNAVSTEVLLTPFPCPVVKAPWAQELTVLRNHACHSDQNLLQMQKGGNILRNRNDQGVLLYPFLLVLIPVINHIQYKGGTEGKGEISQP